MKTVVKKLYEAMFLVDSAEAASDWDGINKVIETILTKVDAEIISVKKWDERRLAYEAKGKSRGTYILCYFKAAGEEIKVIEREVRLSERIIRVLVLNAEHMTQEDMKKETPAMKQDEVVEQRQNADQPEAVASEVKESQVDEAAEPVEEPSDSKEQAE